MELTRDNLVLSDDKSLIDIEVVHGFLQTAYWSEGVPRSIVAGAIENSLCIGVYEGSAQVAFARVITDYSTFAYLADVFVIPSYRGHGIGKWMVTSIIDEPRLQGLRRWLLATRDAHGLYEQVGFRPLNDPSRWMEIRLKNAYRPGC